MYSEPCAKFTMRVTPKTRLSPLAMMNSEDALASPVRNWTTRKEGSIGQGRFVVAGPSPLSSPAERSEGKGIQDGWVLRNISRRFATTSLALDPLPLRADALRPGMTG